MEVLFREYELADHFRATVAPAGQKGSALCAAPTSAPPPALVLPPATIEQGQGAHFPRLLDQGNIENAFPASIRNPNDKRSITFTVSHECHLLSKLVGVAN